MIELALRGGGPDNITCIVADVVDIDFGEDAPIVGGSVGDGQRRGPAPGFGGRARVGHHDDPRRCRAIEPVPAATAPRKRSTLRVSSPRSARSCCVLAAAGGLARLWVMQQYYVGVDADQVAIFQGVRGEVLGVPLHDGRRAHRHRRSTSSPRPTAARSATASSRPTGLDGAHRLVDRLRGRMLRALPGHLGHHRGRDCRARTRPGARACPRSRRQPGSGHHPPEHHPAPPGDGRYRA